MLLQPIHTWNYLLTEAITKLLGDTRGRNEDRKSKLDNEVPTFTLFLV